MKKVWYLLVAAVLIIAGFILNYTYAPMFSAGEFACSYFAAGDFALGVFAAGKFSAGIFSIGIFSIGIFSMSIFNVAIYSVGIFVIAYKKRLPKLMQPTDEENSNPSNQ
ncbi:MAG: hypothetical protein RBT49_07265 [Bacteroidales bacterium]|jgi:hypothetical protein|nr:hypothetical protein [Bacteroidales bacterium]